MGGPRWNHGIYRCTVLTTDGGTISFFVSAYRWVDRAACQFEWVDADGRETQWPGANTAIITFEKIVR